LPQNVNRRNRGRVFPGPRVGASVKAVTLNQLFPQGVKTDWAVGHFNVHNLEFITGVLAAAEEERSPVVVAVGALSIKYMGLAPLAKACLDRIERATVPVCLHLDHCKDMAVVEQALSLGFSSVMFDGSHLPFEENVRLTGQTARLAREYGASVEGEVGIVPAGSGEVTLTKPELAVEFAQRTKVDFLAVSLGSIHGMTAPGARLDLDLLSRLDRSLDCPMVLHGATGVVSGDIREVILAGIRKININTGLKVAFRQALDQAFQQDPDIDLLAAFTAGVQAVTRTTKAHISAFGSAGKA
jgi:ketose-bisphosphate aldolase